MPGLHTFLLSINTANLTNKVTVCLKPPVIMFYDGSIFMTDELTVTIIIIFSSYCLIAKRHL
jgi:hypothetical protein